MKFYDAEADFVQLYFDNRLCTLTPDNCRIDRYGFLDFTLMRHRTTDGSILPLRLTGSGRSNLPIGLSDMPYIERQDITPLEVCAYVLTQFGIRFSSHATMTDFQSDLARRYPFVRATQELPPKPDMVDSTKWGIPYISSDLAHINYYPELGYSSLRLLWAPDNAGSFGLHEDEVEQLQEVAHIPVAERNRMTRLEHETFLRFSAQIN